MSWFTGDDDDAAAGDRTARRVHVPRPHCGHRGAEPEVDAESRQVAHDRIGGRAGVGLQVALDVRSTDEALGAQRSEAPQLGRLQQSDPALAGCGVEHGELVIVPGGDQRARLAQPEARVPGEDAATARGTRRA